jgi:hypothetical protein
MLLTAYSIRNDSCITCLYAVRSRQPGGGRCCSSDISFGFLKEAARCRIEAGFDVSFQYPLRPGAVREHHGTLLHCVGTVTFLPKPVGVWGGGRFGDGVQGMQIQRLHGSVLHRRDTQRTLFPVCFRNVHSPQWKGFVSPLLQIVYGHPFTLRVLPWNSVYPWSVLSNSRRMTKPNSHLDIPVAFS